MLVDIIISLLIGALAGWLAGKIMNSEGSLLRNIILGILGGVIGGVVFKLLGFSVAGYLGTIIVSVIGACLLIWIASLILKNNKLPSCIKCMGVFFMIVPTDISYPFEIMQMNIRDLKVKYDFLQIETMGRSVLGKNLFVIKLGNGPKEIFYSASMHANEWINSVVLMKFVEDYAESYVNNESLYNQNIRELFEKVSIYIAPMVNPDGVDLVIGELEKNTAAYKNAKIISTNFPEIQFPDGWKANILGIDLNLQFPSNWTLARQIKFEQGYTRPAPRDFVGYGPLTEPESLAIYNYTLSHNFKLILTYHTQGEVIFWEYLGFEPDNAKEIANKFAKISGYTLDDVSDTGSYAGYRDWFIENYKLPGFTIETGLGTNPLPISQFNKIYNDNIGVLIVATQQV